MTGRLHRGSDADAFAFRTHVCVKKCRLVFLSIVLDILCRNVCDYSLETVHMRNFYADIMIAGA